MHITVEPLDDVSVLHLRGEFDTFYCQALQKEIDEQLKAGVKRIALNLRLVKFINSTALGAVIRASKTVGAAHGKLVITRPSPFCREIIEKVGIDRVVPMFAGDDEALAALRGGKSAQPGADDGGIAIDDDASVLFTPVDAERTKMFLPEAVLKSRVNIVHEKGSGAWTWRGVGRMASLDEGGLGFTWGGGNTGLTPFEMSQFLAIGTDLSVRFRLTLLKKGLCEAEVKVTEVEERPDGLKVRARFSKIDSETKRAVKQYADDLAFLKNELKKKK